ncbi:hypothetical protein C8F04DRAFT_151994 [Mycena alexandri]|uniref:F-box domain-containing protein n=1 Tax=Mycena alexandri TaxID=1745969 RepID=A0AAD6WTW3_9AGAR|nr:hypothetical protein C8F04DRAFT_151994 [Mycena alexandri]
MSQNACHFLCSEHCATAQRFELNPQSPYPELLLSNAIPSDFQAQEIKKTTGIVEADIAGLNSEIARLQRSMDALIAQRTELERFAHDHRGVVSIVRCLPDDILVEIFEHCLSGGWTFSALKPMLLVSRQWHSVASTSPHLWRHFVVTESATWPHFVMTERATQGLLKCLSFQLELSAKAPLSITLDTSTGRGVQILQLFLDASPRWEEANLNLTPAYFRHLFASNCAFPALKRLTINMLEPPEWPAADIIRSFEPAPAFESVPALRELLLWMTVGQRIDLHMFPWSRLRRCELAGCHIEDLLQILPLLSADTRVFPIDEAPRFTSSVQSPISALEVGRCTARFVEDLLNTLTTPSLKELSISTNLHWSPNFNIFDAHLPTAESIIIMFLSRSACALTSLCLYVTISDHDLLTILESPHVYGLVRLAISSESSTLSAEMVDALTTRSLVPHLQSLDINLPSRGGGLTEATVLAMLERRHPVLHTLRITQEKVDPLLSQAAIEALGAKGMEIMLRGCY